MESIRFDLERQLFEINPYLLGKKIFINDVNENALRIFSLLTCFEVYVEGFLSDELFGEIICNKRIVRKEDIGESDVIICNFFAKEYQEGKEQSAFILNRKIDASNVIIYGAGNVGERVIDFFLNNEITGFQVVDSYMTRKKVKNFDVLPRSYLDMNKDDCSIVISSIAYCDEIYSNIKSIVGEKNIFYCGDFFIADSANRYSIFNYLDGTEQHVTLDKLSYDAVSFIEGKELIIYGVSNLSKRIKNFFELLDYKVIGLIGENGDEDEEVMQIEECLYYPDALIVFPRKKDIPLNKIVNLNFVRNNNYIILDDTVKVDSYYRRKNVMDIFLGHSFVTDYKYPGFYEIGDYAKASTKIVTLGGSTTDGGLYEFSSWPLILKNEIGNDVAVLNGGCISYNSSQELLKLIRDVVSLKPDYLIVYDGINNAVYDKCNEFRAEYSEMVFNHAKEYFAKEGTIDIEWGQGASKLESIITNGVEIEKDWYDRWFTHVRMMNAIAKEFNIKPFFFIQPWLGTKKEMSKKEKRMRCVSSEFNWKMRQEGMDSLYSGFTRDELNERFNNIFCLKNVFDNVSETLYVDYMHLNELGNKIIAKEILRCIPEIK
ncbi:SGNH/GDSL hydrolase family protein [Butyrivibrio hungatei]|uniref:GDSL-like lipase/acylhydrolase n=1 Tax=Butyrivibrio hungatei TaxID=185008 RepID=A0A1D9P446_9FIRM|nr:hypothetical protein [Butyrivibrio hungatei]AOZ97319.1 GDSL-like lipase/acylhydrolase [Butyrivibrio hungatei]